MKESKSSRALLCLQPLSGYCMSGRPSLIASGLEFRLDWRGMLKYVSCFYITGSLFSRKQSSSHRFIRL